MDLKQYISSGIIESYVLGAVSDQERREVECMSKIYPEIMTELQASQVQFEEYAESLAKEVPSDLKSKVMTAISNTAQTETSNEEKEAKVITLSPTASNTNWKAIAAVAAVAVIVFGGLFMNNRSELAATNEQLAEVTQEAQDSREILTALENEVQLYESDKAFLTHHATVQVALSGTDIAPDSEMKIFWNEVAKKMIMYNMELPEPNEELQYQLWAIIDGKPVDLGVFDTDVQEGTLSREANIEQVQAFAVTLEKRGGNPTPNLEQLYVIGNV